MSDSLIKIETCRTLSGEFSGPTTVIYALAIDRNAEATEEDPIFTGGAFGGDEDDSLLLSLELSTIPELANRFIEATHLHFILPDPSDPESAVAETEDAAAELHSRSHPVTLHRLEVPSEVFDTELRIDEDLEPIEGPLHDLYEALWALDGFFLGEGLFGLYNNTYYDVESYGPNEEFILNLSGAQVGGGGKFFFYNHHCMWVQ